MRTCTEGKSLAWGLPMDTIAFSQYSRPSLHPVLTSDLPLLKDIRYMGYSARTSRYRYTEWRKFKPAVGGGADWMDEGLEASELYDHITDPGEDQNM